MIDLSPPNVEIRMSAQITAETDGPYIVERFEAGITHLTLNRGRQLNPLSEEMLGALSDALARAGDDENVRAVVLGANGKGFCAGHDLRQMRSHHDTTYYQTLFERCSGVMRAIIELPKPVIARVQGIATAAGCQLVATCDLAVASDSARFAVSGINVGLFCSTPSVALSRNVARKRAFEMLITGDFIDAEKALEYGLINHAVGDDELDSTIARLTDSIKSKPAVAVETGKRMFYRQLEMPLEQAYRFAGETMACNMMAGDTVEGVDAFLEKRAPSWRS
jgi:enoyl-CoA hydratase/carnithine racemase